MGGNWGLLQRGPVPSHLPSAGVSIKHLRRILVGHLHKEKHTQRSVIDSNLAKDPMEPHTASGPHTLHTSYNIISSCELLHSLGHHKTKVVG
jgi:hypothetical protein